MKKTILVILVLLFTFGIFSIANSTPCDDNPPPEELKNCDCDNEIEFEYEYDSRTYEGTATFCQCDGYRMWICDIEYDENPPDGDVEDIIIDFSRALTKAHALEICLDEDCEAAAMLWTVVYAPCFDAESKLMCVGDVGTCELQFKWECCDVPPCEVREDYERSVGCPYVTCQTQGCVVECTSFYDDVSEECP